MIVEKESTVPNSFGLPSKASLVANIKSKEEIVEIDSLAKKLGLPLFVIGEGTNILPRPYIKGVVAILNLKGLCLEKDVLCASAGEKWDDLVSFAVDKSLSGLEALSAIPGKAGAAPIQNIGAYGSELADHFESLEAYHRIKGEFVTLNKKECQFGYRNSLFKKYPSDFIITSIKLKLSDKAPKISAYKDVERYFAEKNNLSPNLKEIREAIIEIRKNKLPNPETTPNAGSYFTNPILEKENALIIQKRFPEMPLFSFQNKFKIPAGWLLEKAGLKGATIGQIEIPAKNALVLTNPKRVGLEELMEAEKLIAQKVFERFGITLTREPNLIG